MWETSGVSLTLGNQSISLLDFDGAINKCYTFIEAKTKQVLPQLPPIANTDFGCWQFCFFMPEYA